MKRDDRDDEYRSRTHTITLFERVAWLVVVTVGFATAVGPQRARAQDGDEASETSSTAENQRQTECEQAPDSQSGAKTSADNATESTIEWKTWTPDAVNDMLDKGRPVFVAFTAEWDITSKLNRRRVLQLAAVRRIFDECNAATFRADWTDGDKRIRARLDELGFDGVPAYVVYTPDSPQDPHILPQVLSVEDVVSAIETAGGC